MKTRYIKGIGLLGLLALAAPRIAAADGDVGLTAALDSITQWISTNAPVVVTAMSAVLVGMLLWKILPAIFNRVVSIIRGR